MKTLFFVVASSLFLSLAAFAQNNVGPCAPYIQTCKSQGFHFGDHKMVPCMRKIANPACLAHMKAHAQEWREAHGGGAPGAAPGGAQNAGNAGAPPAAPASGGAPASGD